MYEFGVTSSTPMAFSGLQWLRRLLWWLGTFSKVLERFEVAGGVRIQVELAVVCSGLSPRKIGAGRLERRAKTGFMSFAWLVTWELETRGLKHGWNKVLDGGHKSICTLGGNWNPKPIFASVLRWT